MESEIKKIFITHLDHTTGVRLTGTLKVKTNAEIQEVLRTMSVYSLHEIVCGEMILSCRIIARRAELEMFKPNATYRALSNDIPKTQAALSSLG